MMKKGTGKRMAIMLLLVAVVFGGIYGFQLFRNRMITQSIKGQGMPPQAVSTVVARSSTWQPEVEVIGNLRASVGATLAAEVGGLVSAIHFDSGKNAKAGQLLVQLNPGPLQAQFEQLKAAAALAEQTYKRDQAQLQAEAISQAAVDVDAANLKSARAQVSAQQALLAQRAIRAPFSGRLGIRLVDVGQYIAPGTPLVSLQKLDPMFLDFNVPQSQLGLLRIGEELQIQSNARPGARFSGRIAAIEPQIDTATRNIKVRAAIPNPRGELLPGMFATARISNGGVRQYITLPNAAIAYNPYGSTVFVIVDKTGENGQAQRVAEQRVVTTGPTRGDQVAVLSGLKDGETIVTAGQLKLRNGVPVVINNSVQPSNDPRPQVSDE